MTDLTAPCRACQVPPASALDLQMAFQPIVDLGRREIYAYEALVRGPQGQPAGWVFEQFQAAQDSAEAPDVGSLYHLDQQCRMTAIRSAARLGMQTRLSINIMPNAVYNPRTCIQATLRTAREVGFPLERLLFEITEHEQVPDAAHVRHIIDTYRAWGFGTALDDYGAGHANLGLLLAIRPDVVKIDRTVVSGIHHDRWQQAALRHMAGFAQEAGVRLVAEGVEDLAEARCLLSLGITHMQGYALARPGLECLPEIAAGVYAQLH